MQPQRPHSNSWFAAGVACGTVLVSVVAVIVVLILVLWGSMRRATPYQEAMQRVQKDRRVLAALGSPVKDGMFFAGSIQTKNGSGEARYDVPISGPKGKASLHFRATKLRGRWNYNRMIVTLANGDEIDLLASPAKSPAG